MNVLQIIESAFVGILFLAACVLLGVAWAVGTLPTVLLAFLCLLVATGMLFGVAWRIAKS